MHNFDPLTGFRASRLGCRVPSLSGTVGLWGAETLISLLRFEIQCHGAGWPPKSPRRRGPADDRDRHTHPQPDGPMRDKLALKPIRTTWLSGRQLPWLADSEWDHCLIVVRTSKRRARDSADSAQRRLNDSTSSSESAWLCHNYWNRHGDLTTIMSHYLVSHIKCDSAISILTKTISHIILVWYGNIIIFAL